MLEQTVKQLSPGEGKLDNHCTERDKERAMKISYDPEIDALYIRLIEGKHECRTVRLNEEIAVPPCWRWRAMPWNRWRRNFV